MTLPEIGDGLPEVVVRTAIVYLFLVVAMRLSGKRQVGQMSILELIIVLVVADAVQNSMVGQNTSIWGGIVAVITLLAMDFVLNSLILRSIRLRRAIQGEPRLLVRDGRLLARALDEEKVLPDEVRASVRAAGIERLDDVHLAVLETDGRISVISKQDAPEYRARGSGQQDPAGSSG